MAQIIGQYLGFFDLKPQLDSEMLRGFGKIDEKRYGWVLYVGSKKSLRGIFRALWSGGMEDPLTHQFHDELFLRSCQTEARTCLLRPFRLCEDDCCAGAVLEQHEGKVKGRTCQQTLLSTDDTNFQIARAGLGKIRRRTVCFGVSIYWADQCLRTHFGITVVLAAEVAFGESWAIAYGIHRSLHSACALGID